MPTFRYIIDFPRSRVAEWMARPGAVSRLTPGLAPLTPTSEASSLADGTTRFSMPAGLKWIARHQPAEFREGAQFVDEVINQPFQKLTGWKHTHQFDETTNANGSEATTLNDTVDTNFPVPGLASVFAYRATKLSGDLAAFDRLKEYTGGEITPLTIAVSGATGTVGTQLRALLTTSGHTVVSLVRKPEQAEAPSGRTGDGGARY